MCRLLAYAGPPVFLDRLLVEPRASLICQSLAAREAKTVVNGDGCGVGWYGERAEPGVYRAILPAWTDANLVSLCRQIRSPLFVAHVRSATYGEVSTSNCHPFTEGRHLFLHNGQIGGYARLRRHVDALIPDALYPKRRGTSDSEAIFLAALGRGLETDPVAAIAATLAEIETAAAMTGEAAPVRFAAIHADGDALWAYRWASDGPPPSLYWRNEGPGIVIASEPCDDAGSWVAVPQDTVLMVRRDGTMRSQPFRPGRLDRAAA
ncbi:class II glutamine amidotransferase [Aurantimonas sp. A2-1-M11]|uniref:class II glutamine amidotransferase n=1 Tax=Aurantimonas sp. A2-1-M11 TaxID=3113712 RepID=UPI002F91D1E0